jgi:AcrR family transcriptional regulator
MPAVPEYQRARRPEHKAERREAILASARALAVERSVGEVSLGDIARRVGLAKSNVLRYFETREEVYLRLLVREWEAWQVDVAVRVWSAPQTPESVATTLARTFAERPLFCDLVSQMAATLERNVSAQVAREFKSRTIDMVSDLGTVITELLPGLDPEDGREAVAAAIVIVAGLWPMANPSPRVVAMLADTPELVHGRVDFEHRVQHMLAALLEGFLLPAPEAQGFG